jgi:hypothetical protein
MAVNSLVWVSSYPVVGFFALQIKGGTKTVGVVHEFFFRHFADIRRAEYLPKLTTGRPCFPHHISNGLVYAGHAALKNHRGLGVAQVVAANGPNYFKIFFQLKPPLRGLIKRTFIILVSTRELNLASLYLVVLLFPLCCILGNNQGQFAGQPMILLRLWMF